MLTCIRQVRTQEELEAIIAWCVSEGWSARREDAAVYFNFNRNGYYLLVEVDEGQRELRKLGAIFVVHYPNNMAWIGGFIVDKAVRGQGYGRQLWEHAIRLLRDVPAGLYAVPRMQSFYEQSNFRPASNTSRWCLTASKFAPGGGGQAV